MSYCLSYCLPVRGRRTEIRDAPQAVCFFRALVKFILLFLFTAFLTCSFSPLDGVGLFGFVGVVLFYRFSGDSLCIVG